MGKGDEPSRLNDDLDELANNLEREIGVTGAVWDLIARIGRRSVSG